MTACSTGGGGLLDGLGQTQTAAPATNPSAVAANTKGSVTIAPLIGPPDNVAKQLTGQLASALGQNSVQAVPAPAGQTAVTTDYAVRGYVVAARETAGTKVSYIWDVANKAGHRVHRITGEEIVRGPATTNPWAAVTPQVMLNIANRTAVALAAWLPNKKPAATPAPAGTPVAGNQPKLPPARIAANGTPPANAAALSRAGRKTGSIPTQPSALAVVVPRVNGAPGDGSTALALALQKELRKNGIALASGPASAAAHRVEGNVAIGQSKSGKQPISIDWVVKDPKGTKLGTVSQKNEIPAGSLNGKWGPTAGAAAAAAAQGIVRLLPRKTASRS